MFEVYTPKSRYLSSSRSFLPCSVFTLPKTNENNTIEKLTFISVALKKVRKVNTLYMVVNRQRGYFEGQDSCTTKKSAPPQTERILATCPKLKKEVDLFTHILNKYATKVIRLGPSLQTYKPLAIKT